MAFEELCRDREAREVISMVFMKKEHEDKRILIYFARAPTKFTKDDLKFALDNMKKQNPPVTDGIIILQGETSPVSFLNTLQRKIVNRISIGIFSFNSFYLD